MGGCPGGLRVQAQTPEPEGNGEWPSVVGRGPWAGHPPAPGCLVVNGASAGRITLGKWTLFLGEPLRRAVLGRQVGKGSRGCLLLGLEGDTAQLGGPVLQAPAILLVACHLGATFRLGSRGDGTRQRGLTTCKAAL